MVAEHHLLPETRALAETPRACLQESDPLPQDFKRIFDSRLFGFSTSLVPEVVSLYEAVGIKHEPLSLIPPQFETPLPNLRPAVFPPTMRELPPPALELFDLDEHFASERLRLAQLTNKCSDDDLDFFLREAGDILGVTPALTSERRSAAHVLEHILRAVVSFRRLNQDPMEIAALFADKSATDTAPTTTGSGAAAASAGGAASGAGSDASPLKGRGAVPGAAAIASLYQSSLGGPLSGPAGMGSGIAAGFTSAAASAGSPAAMRRRQDA